MDAVLPMGVSSACAIFESFSTALEWVAKSKLGGATVIKDFLFLAHFRTKCERDVQALVNLCFKLGVPLVPGKQWPQRATSPSLTLYYIQCLWKLDCWRNFRGNRK